MIRLHDQIQAGRLGRRTLVADLARGDAEMKKNMRELRGANSAANEERSRRVMAMLSAFMGRLAAHEKGRKKFATKLRRARIGFVNKLAHDIGAMRLAYRAENAAARSENAAVRSAWRGTTSRSSVA